VIRDARDFRETEALWRACAVLVGLVRNEHPADLALSDVGRIWGSGISDEDVNALAWLDYQLSDRPNSASASSTKEVR
jgi:hypothetical protein